ncbi:hypothetical protein Lalb_Chr22g0353331 [Lupinus albus]|uniref:Uncharacterized protein n=1 Tax=Lupinus albus TaxID=3870 RepID=A0A6A4NL18_LUPAL|nr:hypothetical protein Lalb_Chr22g0353331 [Lupinus albus]
MIRELDENLSYLTIFDIYCSFLECTNLSDGNMSMQVFHKMPQFDVMGCD